MNNVTLTGVGGPNSRCLAALLFICVSVVCLCLCCLSVSMLFISVSVVYLCLWCLSVYLMFICVSVDCLRLYCSNCLFSSCQHLALVLLLFLDVFTIVLILLCRVTG